MRGESKGVMVPPARSIGESSRYPFANTPDDFTAFLGTEYERWEKLIRLSGVKVE